MNESKSEVRDFMACVLEKRQNFLQVEKSVIGDLDSLMRTFHETLIFLTTAKNSDGKTLVSFIPNLSIMRRQLFYSVDSMMAGLSVQAISTLRPALETLLMFGKFRDDKKNIETWRTRLRGQNREYNDLFSGKNLVSKTIPISGELRNILSRINDNCVHTNPFYFYESFALTEKNDGSSEINSEFISDHVEQMATAFAILRIGSLIYIGISQALEGFFPQYKSKQKAFSDLIKRHRSEFSKAFLERHKKILVEIAGYQSDF